MHSRLTTIEWSDSEGEVAFMAMAVKEQQSIAKKDYKIMTRDCNRRVLGGKCSLYDSDLVQWNDGGVKVTSRINSMRILEPIQGKEILQLLMTIDQLSR